MPSHRQEYKSRALLGEYQTPQMVLWVLKHSRGMVKTQRQAAYLLFGFIIFTIIAVPYLTLPLSAVVQHPLISTLMPGAMPTGGNTNMYQP
jgi:hypothetical protein